MQRKCEHSCRRRLPGQRRQNLYAKLANLAVSKVIQLPDAHEQDTLSGDDSITRYKPEAADLWSYVGPSRIPQSIGDHFIDWQDSHRLGRGEGAYTASRLTRSVRNCRVRRV